MLPVLVAVVAGGALGGVSRRLLGRMRRGAVIRPGPLEVASALLAGVGVALSWPSGPWLMVCWIGALAVPLSAVDLAHHRLPDALTLPAVPITLGVAALGADSGAVLDAVGRAAAAGLVVGGLFLTLATVLPVAMGRGDAKLAFTIGSALGAVSWPAVPIAVFLAFVIGSVAGIAGMATRRLNLRSALPFGPALLAGCWLVLAVPGLLGWFSPVAAGGP